MFRSLTDRPKTSNSLLRTALAVLLLLPVLAVAASQSAEARYAAVVIEADSGRVLHATNADTRNHPASLTKMMTLYLAFEALDRGRLHRTQKLIVSRRASRMPPSRLGLRRGQTISLENAILALVTKSANDSAVVIAEALAGSESKFARLMTKKAAALGMTRTSFRNASGLHNRRQLSTARDMSKLAQALIRDFKAFDGLVDPGNAFVDGALELGNHRGLPLLDLAAAHQHGRYQQHQQEYAAPVRYALVEIADE